MLPAIGIMIGAYVVFRIVSRLNDGRAGVFTWLTGCAVILVQFAIGLFLVFGPGGLKDYVTSTIVKSQPAAPCATPDGCK